ncbi:hypothetical protein N657DRAFT_652173 [Parathielavia appendiculata]|uniref:K Homology domain-containing protein n=1 Tax=Parathielavia appendiculata TaxID=2587402 RepID=A0AAN6Z7E1_9PEZI|nr:hypothetical protein N657DRAFT_652173 [Parathielavia appendiculata]
MSSEPSAATQLLQQHLSHHVTVEDASDDDSKPNVSAKSTGNGETATPISVKKDRAGLATDSHELFPELGGTASKSAANLAPVWPARANANGKANGKASGASPANGTPKDSAPPSGASTPAHRVAPPSLSIPGQSMEYLLLEPDHILPRAQLKRPLADIVKDFNRKSRAQVRLVNQPDNRIRVEATGPKGDVTTQSLKDFVGLIGTKMKVELDVPRWARPHIIGKGGSTIKALQEKSGARIHVPKEEGQAAADDNDDEDTIRVVIEGNSQQAAHAQNLIFRIMGERGGQVNVPLKGIPAEFFPFIAGPNNSFISSIEQENGIQIRVPPAQAFSSTPPTVPAPSERPVFYPAADSSIHLAGERNAVKAAREAIERRAEELRSQLLVEPIHIQSGRHQFIIGERGVSMEQFFEDTGCTIVIPTDEDDDVVKVIGYRDQVPNAVDKTIGLAMNMQCSNIDIARFHKQAPGGAAAHARHVTRYLHQKRELERLGKAYNVHFNTPFSDDGALQWELYARDGKNLIRAQTEVKALVDGLPPARVATVPVDPFYHHYIRREVMPQVRQNYGVHMVVPEASEANAPLLLVYEGFESPASYQVPRSPPSQQDIAEMQKWLQDAQGHVLGLMSQQEAVTSKSIEVPLKFHTRLQKFIKNEQDNATNPVRARVSNNGETVIIRGPASVVDRLTAKCVEFVEQEKQDDKERGFTLEFDFPQKFANHLIGKGGSNIRDLREKFDVEIQVQDGKVQLKGPKAKAEAAKTHIVALGRQLQDEATHVLKIDPKFHRELIGAQGSQINKLQTRYKVLIFFPRNKNAKDDESVAESASDAGKGRRQQAPDEVIIRGPKRGADEARDELLSLLQYLKDTSFTATVTVQKKMLPSLIGAGGAVLEQLRQSTGAKIDVPSAKDSEDPQVEIHIKGTKTQVTAAKKALEEKKAIFDDTVVEKIEVPRIYHKALIGTGGATLRDIVVQAGGPSDQRELARTIQFPKQDADGNTIKVEGRSEVVKKIVARIQALVAERESQVTDAVDVPVEKHRTIVGRGGETKRNLEAQFKVSLDVPRQGSGQTSVKIVGQSADVEKAKAHIQNLVKEQPGETVQIPRALHHAVSNNGQIFRRLRNDFGVTIDHGGQTVPPKPTAAASSARANGGALPLITDEPEAAADAHSWKVVEQASSSEEGDIPWILRGSAENVEKAKKAIQTALEQATKHNAVGYLVLPDPKTYRFVIGQGGSKVNAIRKQSGCKITVPRDQAQGEAIEVVGSREGVEKAKELILAAVKEGVSARSTRGE